MKIYKDEDIIISKTNNVNDYFEKYVKVKFNSNDDLPLKKR